MKSFQLIKKEADRGDYASVAKLAGVSRQLVAMVVNGDRTDHNNIQRIFSDYLSNKINLQRKYRKQGRRAVAL